MIGKLHPLLVHLPIGFFFLALLIRVLIALNKISVSESFFKWVLLSTFVVSLLSMGTGWLLSGAGEYDAETLIRHQWSAVVFSATLLLLYFTRNKARVQAIPWGMALVVLTFTGHYGGTLTHGADFLQVKHPDHQHTIENAQEAVVYEEIIRPILEKKCYSCHGSGKQKGKLRLDSPEFLLKGGADGPALEAFHPDKSLLMVRMLLPDSDEDHMPPKGKPQVTEEEKALIEWWINGGADFRKKSRELAPDEKIQKILRSLEAPVEAEAVLPEKEVKPGAAADLEVLKKAGVLVNPAGLNTNYLEVNLRGISPGKDELKALEGLKEQVIRLNAASVQQVEELAEVTGKLQNLRVLHLQRTPWSDQEMTGLKGLSHLRVLNLSFTRVTEKGLKELDGLKELRRLYVYSSGVKDRAGVMSALPGVLIDTGGYRLNTLPGDSLDL